jgi:PAS domain S-box-containing protein
MAENSRGQSTHTPSAGAALPEPSAGVFRTIFRASPESVSISRAADGVFLDVNEGFERLSGYRRDEVIGRSSLELGCWAEGSENRSRFVQQLRETGSIRDYEARWRHRDGRIQDCEISGEIVDHQGVQHLVLIVRDVTDKNRALAALRESEERYRHVFEASTDGISIRTMDGKLIAVNPAMCEMHGYSHEEYLSLPNERVIPPQMMPMWAEFKRTLQHQGHFRREVKSRHRDGHLIDFDLQGITIPYQGGTRMVTIARNITETKRAAEALAANERLLRTVLNASPNSIFVKDRDGRYLMVNEAMARRNGTTVEAMVGTRDTEYARKWLTTPEQVERFRRSEQDVIDSREPLFIPEEQYVFTDGTTGWFQTTKIPLTVNDNPNCLLGVAVDITRRKLAEIELRRLNEELAAERTTLNEKNIALSEVLKHMEEERQSYKHEICDSVEKLIMPVLTRLKGGGKQLGVKELAVLEDSIKAIVAKDIDRFTSNLDKLSSRELDVCELIRRGYSSKEIAEKLNISEHTVLKHRQAIRRKLQLANKDVNLAAYLRSR